jgi:hypothetical protein
MNDENRDLPVARTVTVAAQAATAAEVKGQVQRIQQVMRAVMKRDVHYGQIPGTQKPTLYKAGSEVLLTAFHLSVDPQVEDLSTHDEVRYRVRARGMHQMTGIMIGVGVGEASSNEEKYRWRKAVCQEEFNDTDEDRRRVKYQHTRDGVLRLQQVRTVPADVANTVLKMAKKRAQIDLCLTALAASDCFTQDLEDMPDEVRESVTAGDREAPRSAKPATERPQATGTGRGVATERQQKLIHARLDASGLREDDFLAAMDVDSIAHLPFAKVDEALKWIADRAP